MEVLEALKARRSVRRFTSEPISEKDLGILLPAAMSGPSACNLRPWEFFVIRDEKILEQLRGASPYTGIVSHLAIVVAGNRNRFLPVPNDSYWVQDCSAASENILLAATDLNLGAVWCGIYPQENAVTEVRNILKLDKDVIPLNIIYVGHPDQYPEARDQYDEKYVHML